MEEKRTSGVWIVAVVLVLLLLPPIAYVAGYFLLCKREVTTPAGYGRFYSERWQVVIFEPAAKVDSMLRDGPVEVGAVPENGIIPF